MVEPRIPLFARTDEQCLVVENLRRLLVKSRAAERNLGARDGRQPARGSLWASLAELGIIGAGFEERCGGFAGDARTIAVIMAELGWGLAQAPYLECAVVAGRILQGGSERADGKSRIEAIVGGREIYVLAHSPAVTSSTLVAVTGSGRGNDVVLRGRIPSVRHASDAHVFLVPILVDNRGLEIFQVPRSSPGLNLQPYRLIDGAQAADLTFQEVILGADTKLPLATDPQVVLEDCLQWGMLASIAEALGIMRALNTATFSYLMTRKQFGAAIGTFQALRHRVADMHIAAEETLAIADAAIESFSAGPGPERTALISAAKVVADRAARRIGAEAVQLHGAMGVSDELDVSHYARRLIAIRYSLGSTDSHRSRFANTR